MPLAQLEGQILETALIARFLFEAGDLDHHIAEPGSGRDLDGGEALLFPLLLGLTISS